MFQEDSDDFKFEWSHFGDIDSGRPNLGATTSVAIYRLMQFTLRDAANKHTEPQMAERIFYDAVYNSGQALYENMLAPVADFGDLVTRLQKLLLDFPIGILRIEESGLENLRFTLTVCEDLDCSGLAVHDEAICIFDEGLIAGLLESFAGIPFKVQEVDCWCTGDRTC